MEHVWSYLFDTKMKISTAGKHVMLTEAPLNPRKHTEKMAEVMFEKYGFGAMQVGVQALMTLYAQGSLTGVVLDSGDGVTHIVAVYEGCGLVLLLLLLLLLPLSLSSCH
jgi:actin-related protein 2